METEKRNLYSRYKQDADASKHGYYGYELWLEKKLIEAESELKKLRVADVSVSVCEDQFCVNGEIQYQSGEVVSCDKCNKQTVH